MNVSYLVAYLPAGGGPGEGGGLIMPLAKHDPPRLPTLDSFFNAQFLRVSFPLRFQATQASSFPQRSQHSSSPATNLTLYDAPNTQLPYTKSVRQGIGSCARANIGQSINDNAYIAKQNDG